MNKLYRISFYILAFTCLIPASALPQGKPEFKGHIKSLQDFWIQDVDEDWITWGQLKNRLDASWQPLKGFGIRAGLYNNLTYGQLLQLSQDFKDVMDEDPGYLDLTIQWASGSSYVLTSAFDRAYLEYRHDKWMFRAGRQRVNWGMGLVWNPNDIFNTYSYFDFDYEEKPGSDAIRFEYYTSGSSAAELVAKLDDSDSLTLSAMYRANTKGYDLQFFGGFMPTDYLMGAGWSGQVKGAGFRGEFTLFFPKEELTDAKSVLIGSIDADYTLKNSFYLHAAWLYNSAGTTGDAGRGEFLEIRSLTPKDLTDARMSVFGQLMYPVTPLLNASLAGILNPYDLSYFIGPMAELSLRDDLYLMLNAQLFRGEEGTEFGGAGSLVFLRLRWDF